MSALAPLPASPRSDATRAALVAAGLDLFGRRGFEATSTREIAAAAGVNLAAIAYQFGSTDGLRLACADFIAARLGEIFAAGAGPHGDLGALDRAGARAALADTLSALVQAIVMRPDALPMARFIMREMFDPSSAFERIYAGAVAPLHARACAALARATGWPAEAEATRLAVFSFIGQVLYFRLARPAILRRMNWREIEAREGEAIRRQLLFQLDAFLEHAGPTPP